jgi:hypothetical protein
MRMIGSTRSPRIATVSSGPSMNFSAMTTGS